MIKKTLLKRSAITLVIVSVVLSFGLFTYTHPTSTSLQTANVNVNTVTKPADDQLIVQPDAALGTIAVQTATPDPNVTDQPPTNRTSYSSQCQGVGCVTANPSFSIVTPRSFTVEAGSHVGPFAASTSSGASVNWTTPQYNGDGHGPSGYVMNSSDSANTSTMQFYIGANPNVTPGSYTLYMSAIKTDEEAIVRTTITVNVTAPQTEQQQ